MAITVSGDDRDMNHFQEVPSPIHEVPATSLSNYRQRGHLWRSRWAAIGAAVAVAVGAGGIIGFAGAASSTPSNVVAITPVRILDTRDPLNVGLAGPFVSATAQDLKVTGNVATTTGNQIVVPDGATAVLLNVTSVSSTAEGFISVRPADAPGAPSTSSLNFRAGATTPNAVTVALPTAGGDAGKIEIVYDALGTAGPQTDVLVDVVGYTLATTTTSPYAVVDQNGVLSRGVGVVSVTPIAGVPLGDYAVVFNRDITSCVYQATVGRPAVSVGPPIGFAMVANWQGDPVNGVVVFIKDQDGAGQDRAFHLTVTC